MRPILVGLNNPHSDDSDKALGLHPVEGSGSRLWLMIKEVANAAGRDFSEADYVDTFDRVNLVGAKKFSVELARQSKSSTMVSLKGRDAVFCGSRVPRLLGLPYTGFHLQMMSAPGFVYFVIPHPSGLNREYNDSNMRQRVGKLLFDLHRDYRREQGR